MPLRPQQLRAAAAAAAAAGGVYAMLTFRPATEEEEEEAIQTTPSAAGAAVAAKAPPASLGQQQHQQQHQQRRRRRWWWLSQEVSAALPFALLAPAPAGCFFKLKDESALLSAEPFEAVWEMGPKLGSGAFATVHKCTEKATKRPGAVKVFDLTTAAPMVRERIRASVLEEVDILQSLKHPAIVEVKGLYEREKERLFFVMEFCEGGELFDRIVKKTTYNEKEARDVIHTLLSALAYCHENRVVHRDLKPENLLLPDPECDLHIKVADFGAAARIRRPNSLRRYCGTPGYTAPEILAGKRYGEKVDVWSAGVIIYILLGGYPPFADSEDQVAKQGTFEFHSPEWDNVSEEAKDLISKLLVVDPAVRLSAKEALQHRWFEAEEAELAGHDLNSARKGIEKFNARRKWRGAVKAVIATNRMKFLLAPHDDDENGHQHGLPPPSA